MALVLDFLLASLPLALLVLLMLGARWSAARAGAVGLVTAIILSWTLFDFGDLPRLTGTLGSLLEGAFTAALILWIVFAALCLYYLQLAIGATETLRQAAFRLARNRVTVILLVAWLFPLFMEGAAGFGTPVALAAPLLVSLGVKPVSAVTIALIGHAAGVPFGAVGTPVLVQSVITGHGTSELAGNIAPYVGVVGWVLLGATVFLGMRALPGPQVSGLSVVGWTLAAGALFLGPYLVIAITLGPELPTLGAAVLGGSALAAILVLARRFERTPERQPEFSPSEETNRSVAWAATPYLVLVALILVTRLIPELRESLQNLSFEWRLFNEFTGAFQPLYHPGTVLFVSFLIGGALQHAGWRRQCAAATDALRRLGSVAIALIIMLTLSRVMLHAGMIEDMAAVSAEVVGASWPVFAPGLAALGSFVTGSATASNVLFTDFQQQVARLLGLRELPLMGAQGFGGAIGNIVSPHNIIAGSATVGIVGQEGAVLRRTMAVFVICLTLGGLLALAWTGIAAG